MGKHSPNKTHKRTFNKTMAVALAAGVSFGGVQVVSAQTGHELSGVASAAEITDKGLVSNLKVVSKKDGTEFKEGTVTQEEHDKFVAEHGDRLTLSFDVDIPDTAQPGDTIKVEASKALHPTVEGRLPAKTADGTIVAYFTGDKILVSDEAGGKQNRKAHFEIPFVTNASGEFALTLDENLVGTPAERNLDFIVNGEKVFERTETGVYKQDHLRHKYMLHDKPRMNFSGIAPNVDTGVMINYWSSVIGHADKKIVETIGDAPRDAEFRYTINDENSKIIANVDQIKERASALKYDEEGVRAGARDVNHFVDAEPFPYDVEIVRHSDQDVTIKFKGVPANRALKLNNIIAVETAYVPGKTVTLEGKTITVGEPKDNFDEEFEPYVSQDYTMDSWSGFASADDVKRSATLETRVSGKDADTNAEAVKFNEGDVADFELELKNTGNIGARYATVTLPEGMHLPNGETSFEHDFGDTGFPPGSTKKIDVKGVQILNGTNPNNFTVDMVGYETLSDPAWTTVDDKDIYIEDVEITDDNKLILHRNDGEDLDVDLPESTDVVVNEDGDLVITKPGEDPVTVPIKHTIVEEIGKPGSPDYKLVITDENGDKHEVPLFDKYLDYVEQNENGDYRLVMTDGDEHIIKVGDTIVDIDDDGKGNLIIRYKDGTTNVVPIKHTTVKEVGIPGSPDHKLVLTDVDGNEHEIPLYDEYLDRVEQDENGDYRLIMKDGTEHIVKVGDTIISLEDDGKGNLIIKHKDGSTITTPIKHTTVTETGEGTPDHKVTITTPDGESIDFNVFDTYVTDVVKNEDGDYDIYRSDIDDGKTVWKTIVLSDLRDQIGDLQDRYDKLEKKDDALQDEIDRLKERMDQIEDKVKDLDGRTSGLEDEIKKINARLDALDLRISAIDARIDVLEGRVDKVEDTNSKWAKCYSGIGMAAIPAVLAAPILGLAGMDIPVLKQANTDIQKQIGVYNPELAKMWGQYGGIAQAAAGLLGLMGAIGAITYASNECAPYNQTDDVKDTKLGKLSSKHVKDGASSSVDKKSASSDKKPGFFTRIWNKITGK